MLQKRIIHCAWLFLITLCLSLSTAHVAQAQGLESIGLNKSLLGDQSGAGQDPEKLRQSLDVVIQSIEDEDQRRALLAQLKAIREGTQAKAADGTSEAANPGLLGALADTLTDARENAKAGRTPVDYWLSYSQRALLHMRDLIGIHTPAEIRHSLWQIAVGLSVWLGCLLLLAHAGKLLFRRRGWPRTLPPDPHAWDLVVHFLRRVLPALLTFVGLLASMKSLDATTATRVVVLVVAYITLCARTLTSVVDVVISLFTSGHRRPAVAILHRTALKPLFVIGCLIAFSDAASGERLTRILGSTLSGWLSETASLIAALVSGWLVLRVRRPMQHLIRNRPYRQRRNPTSTSDLVALVANLWHVPALLAIGASVLAIVLTGGSTEIAFAKAVVCAVLLALALLLAGLLRRQRERHPRPPHRNRYVERFARLGYTLKHFAIWVIFAEATLQVWNMSLLGIGSDYAINEQFGRALVAMGLTALIASLVWIIVDTALERSLGGGRRRGQRKVTARTQTVVPMLRNTVFFAIAIIAGIVALANLGVNVTPLLAGAGIIGVAVGFGAQNLVQDLITGIFILVEDSIAVGDFIEINDHMGTVEGLNLRTVRLRDLDGVLHFITFSHISSIHNMSRQFGIALLRIRVPHDLPIDDAIALMREAGSELRKGWRMGRLIRSSIEMQGIQGFEDGCPILRMRIRTAPEYQWDVARAFNLKLKQVMEQHYVNLASPRLSVTMEAARHGGDGQEAADADTVAVDEKPRPATP